MVRYVIKQVDKHKYYSFPHVSFGKYKHSTSFIDYIEAETIAKTLYIPCNIVKVFIKLKK